MQIQEKYPDIDFIETSQSFGKNSGLYISLAYAYKYALLNYEFTGLLRLDTDALITGHNPEETALTLFRNNKQVGLAGRHIFGSFSPGTPGTLGAPWDNRWIRKTLVRKAFSWVFFRRPFVNYKLRNVLLSAFENGYDLGESIFGGAYIFSKTGLQALQDAGLLPLMLFHKVGLEEDHLFSLLIKYVNLSLVDLAGHEMPFGCAWIGLPASPEELVLNNKKIIHSTRSWNGMDEDAIRDFFKLRRI